MDVAADPRGDTPRYWLMATVVLVWAVRLTANWAYAFPGLHHEDWRYPMLARARRPAASSSPTWSRST